MGQLTKTQLREDIAKALATVEAKHSMKLNIGFHLRNFMESLQDL